MRSRPIHPRHLDVAPWCDAGGQLDGRLQGRPGLDEMPRLADSLHRDDDAGADPGPGFDVVWSARGELRRPPGSAAQPWLHLKATGQVPLLCQRCLSPMSVLLDVERSVRFVADEDEAERLDAELEDDVLALPRRLNLLSLLEDELILALPIVPRHETCPVALPVAVGLGVARPVDAPDQPAPATADATRPHPFAALAALRRDGGR